MPQEKERPKEKHEVSPTILALDKELKAANNPFIHGSQRDAHMENAKNALREFNALPEGKRSQWAKDVAKVAKNSPELIEFLRENLNHQIVGPNYAQDTSASSAEVLKYMVSNGMLDGKTNRAVNTELAEFGEYRSKLNAAERAGVL